MVKKKKEARYPKAKYPSFLALILECSVRAVIIAVVLYTLYNTASFKSPQGGWGDSIIAIVLGWWVFAPIIDFWIKVRNFNDK